MSTRKIIYKILGVAAALIFTVVGVVDHRKQVRLQSMGYKAVLDRVGQYTDRSKNGVHTYTAMLSFKTEAGAQVQFNHSFPESALEDFKADMPVTVFYDPSDPEQISFAKEKPDWWMALGGVVGVVAVVLFV